MIEVIHGLAVPAAPETPRASLFNLSERTDLAVASFDSLGLVADKGAATEAIGQHMQTLHDSLVTNRPEVGVEPFMAIELSEQFGMDALVKAFDAKQTYPTHVFSELWGQYTPAELNSRQANSDEVAVSDNTGLSGQARAMLLGSTNDHNEAGLYFTGQNRDGQVKSVAEQELVNPPDYIVLNAQRREADEPLIDNRTTLTCFVQLTMKTSDGDSWTPRADSDGSRLCLYRSYGRAYSGGGVRLSVGPKA